QLPYKIPVAAKYQLIAGRRGDARKFLLVVTQPGVGSGGAIGESIAEIIDPLLPEKPLGRYKNSEVATLRALLDFETANREEGDSKE
ncbi:hypothetical protein Q8G50_32530, partial [Klebsiella pneumoniae]